MFYIWFSGCGNTTLLLSFIYRNYIPYKNLFVFTKAYLLELCQKFIQKHNVLELEANNVLQER